MGYAKNIGRLGALAIALGVGYGVADMPSAFADSNGSADSSSGARVHSRNASAAGVGASHRGTSSASQAGNSDHTAPAAAAVRTRTVTNSAPVSAAAVKVAASAAPAAVDVAPAAPAPAAATAAPQAAPAAATSVAPATANRPARPAASAARPAAAFGSLVSAALTPLASSGTGGTPGQAPALFGVLAWARKEFEKITGFTPPAAVVTNAQLQSGNLLVNPGAESSTPSGSGFSAVSMPGWTVTGTPTVIKYGTPKVLMPLGLDQPLPNLPMIWSFPKADSGPADGGNQFFGGGNVADSTISQTVDLKAAGAKIDGGNVSYSLGGWLGGYSFDPSAASVKVTFLDDKGKSLGTGAIGPVTGLERRFGINLLERSTTGVLPIGTRAAEVEVTFTDKNPVKIGFAARYNDAFADNISFSIGADLPAPGDPTPPVSTVGALKHVYMWYMENKGYSDIVGSPNAPFLNGLINAYGFANNYYALTHGSLPNYYAIPGGDNFGITYNCGSPCIDATNILTTNIQKAKLTWKDYAQGLEPGGDPLVSTDTYAFDESPFPAFKVIANDPNLKSLVVPLEQLATDLQSATTAPSYAWIDANEDNNGEGPVDFPWGALKFAINQLDPKHQYNVAALDNFLAETVPTVMNSAAWKSNEASVIVVTFDEDNNNLSLGFGNEGNHIVTVVIPNQAAIDAGMRAGHFLATDQYNHYSLLRMIEDSLGLPTLTQNDKYANPMNEFWV